ncbi:MAG: hypothetical protein JOZ24_02365 [Candidatus Eremiobacteraeota bacterium]|nr:hypothetical protein [Candidatus Eremiobacteraeota bacterium]
MDAAQDRGAAAVDRATRKRAYAASQRLLARDLPIVFVYWPKNTDLVDARLQHFAPNPMTSSWNAQDWTFPGR